MLLQIALILSCGLFSIGSAQSCGQSPTMRKNRAHDPDGQRIVGGVEARPGSHPWIVTLQSIEKTKGAYDNHFCGGTLISVGDKEKTDIVVTAAHCVEDELDMKFTVTAGAHDLTKPTKTQQTVGVEKLAIHKEYDSTSMVNDIAIVKLKTPIKFAEGITFACLPTATDIPADGTELTVAGWGHTKEKGKNSAILKQAGVPVVNPKKCVEKYTKAGDTLDDDVMICAGHETGGHDSCQNDSGGPLVAKKGTGYVLHGVVSWGAGCAKPGLPGVYVRVPKFIKWINDRVKELSTVRK